MLELPGLIDPHVHLREPGATYKEDFKSGTAAALAGGFTIVLAMPNTQPPITDPVTLEKAKALAQSKALCDYGIFLGAGEGNVVSAGELAEQICGMKMYLDQTYGSLRLQGLRLMHEHVARWPARKPIAVHAEGTSLAAILLLAAIYDKHVHVCHVSLREEIILIRAAKERGFKVTCEVTPHHLFLTSDDVSHLGRGRSAVRPRLAGEEDRAALWENLAVIDCFATDHAPHTAEEKDSEEPPPGFPGLETALPLLLEAVADERMTQDELVARMHTNPAQIFNIPIQQETRVEIDLDARWEVRGRDLVSRCGWTPFEGMQLRGKVRRVNLRGQLVFEDGELIARPGYGRDITDIQK
jgi:carbamoyl-phosphate synthase/aspartate carbamoyltransferase/dihydroorotase